MTSVLTVYIFVLTIDVIKWKHFPRYWPFVRGIHRSTVNSPHKGQWRGALMFSLICASIHGWVNNREAGDLGHHLAHYDVIVMTSWNTNHHFVTVPIAVQQGPQQNGPYFAYIFQGIWLKEISVKFVTESLVDNQSASVQTIAWYQTGDTSLIETMMIKLPRQIETWRKTTKISHFEDEILNFHLFINILFLNQEANFTDVCS